MIQALDSMSIKNITVAIVCFVTSACSTTGTFTGKVTNTENEPVMGVSVQFWQNKWVPLQLPERVAEAKTGSDGSYEIVVMKHVSFIVIENDAGNYSRSVKPQGKKGKYHNNVQAPRI